MIAVTGRCTASDDAEDRAQALTRMVGQYQGTLLRMCYLYLRDAIAAQDAVQETFLKAYKGYEAFRGESQERTWLMSIAINVCRDMNRSAWLRHIDRRVTPEDVPLPAPQDEEALALAEAIRRMPNRHRDVILLYYYQDMTIKEVAEALHAAPSTILKRLNQAKDKLKTLLTEDELSPAARKEGLR